MSTHSKRRWRAANPERSAEAERVRAWARRQGRWPGTDTSLGAECRSSDSYWRYENSDGRIKQRMFYPRYGAGAHLLSRDEFREAGAAILAAAETRLTLG